MNLKLVVDKSNIKRTAVIFVADTEQLSHASLMLESLRDPLKGNYSGDIWVLSTGLTSTAKNYLDSIGALYIENQLLELDDWKYRKEIAFSIMEKESSDRQGIPDAALDRQISNSFRKYINKYLSKLIYLDWFSKVGDSYDFIAFCDFDLYIQSDINVLMEKYFLINPDTVYYWQEENEVVVNSELWKRNNAYAKAYDATHYDFGKHDINIGFLLGSPKSIGRIINEIKKGYFSLSINLITKSGWNGQDIVRLDRARNPKQYSLVDEGEVLHVCNGGEKIIEERYPGCFYNCKTNTKPCVVHFAENTHMLFESIKSAFLCRKEEFYSSIVFKKDFDNVRQGSILNIFDATSEQYFTEQNKKSRDLCRKEWLKLANNGKRKLIFIGWLQTNTHRSTREAIKGFFDSDEFDIAVLNGNVINSEIDYLTEEFPDIIAYLTRITKDPMLIYNFGFRIAGVPGFVYEDAEKAAMIEYSCSQRTATAVANLIYMYFSNALDFYRPDLTCVWGFLSPWGKMITALCKWKGIPICSLEWGILPGTVAFDFCGHMGESWVSKYSAFFNSLDINEKDLSVARDYLGIATNGQLSRNEPTELDLAVKKRIMQLKEKGKKLILFIGTNSAHSGNTLANEERANIHAPHFKNDEEIYADLNCIIKNHPDWILIYKPHPIEITRGLKVEIDETTTMLIAQGSLEKVIELCDVSVTLVSQGAYVSLIGGRPCVVLGRIQINDSGAVYTIDNKEEFEKKLQQAIDVGYTDLMKESFLKHVARALKYYVFSANEMVKNAESYEMAHRIASILDGDESDYYKYERNAYLAQIENRRVAKKEPIVSVIMPVFNAAEYLLESINSILRQTLADIELICVNNGSTDNSQEILDYIAGKDDRVRLFYQSEPNQRAARNLGYKEAKGDYVYLIDSDDYLDNDALEKLVKIADENKADLLYFFFKEVSTNCSYDRSRPRWYCYKRFFPKEKVFKLTDDYRKFFIQYPFPWAKLIRRQLVIEKSLYFDMDCTNFDDNPHNLRTLLSAENAYVLNEQLYNFRIHEKSMTKSTTPRILGMYDAIRIMNKIYDDFQCYDEYAKWYVPYKVHMAAWAWDMVPDDLREEYYNKIKSVFIDGDELYFSSDSVWSYFEMPNGAYLDRVKRFLKLPYDDYNKEISQINNVILIGAGKIGKKALAFYGKNKVKYFADNDSLKVGQECEGVPIISVGDLKKYIGQYSLVISTKQISEISSQLQDMGIEKFEIFI